jgi:hypothetical protein
VVKFAVEGLLLSLMMIAARSGQHGWLSSSE